MPPKPFDWNAYGTIFPAELGSPLYGLAGTDKIRADLGRGEAVEEIVDGWMDGLEAYEERSEEFLLYQTEGA